MIEVGNFVRRPNDAFVYKVADIIETERADYAVLIDSNEWPVDNVDVKDLVRVNIVIKTIEIWEEI